MCWRPRSTTRSPEVAVIGVDDAEFGQRLKAFVVLEPGVELGATEVVGHVKANLAGYKAPREVEFLPELPRNATGKVLKRVLRDGAPAGGGSSVPENE